MTDPPGHVLCCPDKFRGSISAPAAARALARGVEEAGIHALAHPLADGGEGTLDTVLAAAGGRVVCMAVPDARGRRRSVRLGILRDGTALVEMAQAVGLASLAPNERDVMRASTVGVGRMIRRALELSPRRIVVTIGGSATMDGGLGALRELGARLLDSDGHELAGSGADLTRVARIDTSDLDVGRPGSLELAVDAWCPLHGEKGTAYVFGPQKGAEPSLVGQLDRGFQRLAGLLNLPQPERERLGSGGAFAAPFYALTGARVRSGSEFVREATGFEAALDGARLCVTGEGRVDAQSGLGKTVLGVIEAAMQRSIRTIVVGGSIDDGAASLYGHGASAVLPIGRRPRSWEEARTAAASDLRWTGRAVGGLLEALGSPGGRARRSAESATAPRDLNDGSPEREPHRQGRE